MIILYIGHVPKVILLKLYLDMVTSSRADKVTTCIPWMLSWRMQMGVNSLVLATLAVRIRSQPYLQHSDFLG